MTFFFCFSKVLQIVVVVVVVMKKKMMVVVVVVVGTGDHIKACAYSGTDVNTRVFYFHSRNTGCALIQQLTC